MKNFWQKLDKPFFTLAPMADVTDCVFRQIIAKYGKPSIFFTEFVSADGLCSIGREKLLVDLKYSETERPIVAQIFGSRPENIEKAASLCEKLGFDGIDINMGCPDKSIEKQCAGAALIKEPKLAREIIRATKRGAPNLPVSVKTRIGYNPLSPTSFEKVCRHDYLLDVAWIKNLLAEDLAALTVHLRTRKEMSNVPAHWELVKEIVQTRNKLGKDTLIIGNGDVVDTQDAKRKCEEYSCDGVMLGRAIFGNPWLFAKSQRDTLTKNLMSKCLFEISIQEKLQVMLEHTKLFEQLLGKHKNFAIMKKHFKAYVNGFDGAKELRIKLMEAENASDAECVINDFLMSSGVNSKTIKL